MSDVENLNGISAGPEEAIQQSVNPVDDASLSTVDAEASPLISEEGNLTISTLESAGEASEASSSEGVESPSARSTEDAAAAEQEAVEAEQQAAENDAADAEAAAEADAAEETGETEDEGDTGDTSETTAAEDIALATGTVLADALLIAASASGLELDSVQSILNKYKQADDADDTGEPNSPSLLSGQLSIAFDIETNRWNAPADGLTESFAASMARLNQDPSAGRPSASLGELLGYELIESLMTVSGRFRRIAARTALENRSILAR